MATSLTSLINQIGKGELAHYLEGAVNNPCFALIKVSGGCYECLENLVEDVEVLQAMDLSPLLVMGWGKILNRKLEERGIATVFAEGNRVTDKATVGCIGEVIDQMCADMAGLAAIHGVQLEFFAKGEVIEALPKMQYTGTTKVIDGLRLLNACIQGKAPVVFPLGLHNGELYNINGDDVAGAITRTIHPRKYVALTPTGGILDQNGKLIRKISIADDYDRLLAQGVVSGGMAKKLEEARQVLTAIGNGYAVQIASPAALLSELFTYDGAGTKIVKGYITKAYPSLSAIDTEKLAQLFEGAFNRKLVPEYFASESIAKVILEEDYDGAVVLERPGDIWYMDKLAVCRDAQGTGLGLKLFNQALAEAGGKLFWRARKDNPINGWYANQVQQNNGGCVTSDKWVTYWIGAELQQVPKLVEYVAAKPASFL